MTDREKVIEWLEMSFRYSNVDESNTLVPQQLVLDAIALLKAQEPRAMAGAELTDAELIEEIRKAPIVLKPDASAIPVKWLQKYTAVGVTPRGDRLTEGKERLIVQRILNDWQKEQEAR